MTLRDRIQRWWNPGKWKDEHPEISDGEGFPLTEEDRLAQTVELPPLLERPRLAAGLPSGESDLNSNE